MNPFRCSNCNKLLGMIEGKAEIKCPKCKTMNQLKQGNAISYERACQILQEEMPEIKRKLDEVMNEEYPKDHPIYKLFK